VIWPGLPRRQFEKETGTEVRLVPNNCQATSKELLDRLIAEKEHTQADVFWSCDPGGAVILKSEGLSARYESPNAKTLTALYRDPEHHWTGFPVRACVIIYNKNLLADPEEVPSSVLDMMNPRFGGKACIPNPLIGTALLHAAALFQVLGEDFAEAFFNGLKINGVEMVSTNSEVRRRVAAGDFAFGVADTEDFSIASKEGEPLGVGVSGSTSVWDTRYSSRAGAYTARAKSRARQTVHRFFAAVRHAKTTWRKPSSSVAG
jgi:iron(III) transport system substrate-binding protein